MIGDGVPRRRNPLTLTTTLTFPAGFKLLLEGAIGTLTGVFDLRDGLEADEGVGVPDLESLATVRAGGTMVAAWHKNWIHSSMTVQYRL